MIAPHVDIEVDRRQDNRPTITSRLGTGRGRGSVYSVLVALVLCGTLEVESLAQDASTPNSQANATTFNIVAQHSTAPAPELIGTAYEVLGNAMSGDTALVVDDSEVSQPNSFALLDSKRIASSMQLVVTMAVVGLIPALLLMTTSYVRISIVLSLLRQAFGTQQLVPAQATTALAIMCTTLIMWPTWSVVNREAVQPLLAGVDATELQPIFERGITPVREFMVRQIKRNDNAEDVHVFLRRIRSPGNYPSSYEEVPLQALLPGFLLSELKTAFLIGFQIYLPFLVIDLVVATFATSLGMFMLPPAMVSLPLKLLMFVMVGGWNLILDMLLNSFV